jgi:hypothetical protein
MQIEETWQFSWKKFGQTQSPSRNYLPPPRSRNSLGEAFPWMFEAIFPAVPPLRIPATPGFQVPRRALSPVADDLGLWL